MSDAAQDRSKQRFGILEHRIGYEFSNHANLEQGLTHSSVRKNSADDFHYERLEFLGDRVLGLCVAQLLFEKFPDANEGELSLRLNALVKGKTLAEIADRINLHEFIRTGGDLKQITGKRMQSVRADVMEALIASIYLDGGLSAARTFIERFWSDRLMDIKTARRDSKTALQEWAHANRLPTPKYVETNRSGPDHEPVFTVVVQVEKHTELAGAGRSKRIAEQDAAKNFLLRESIWTTETPEAGTS